jgi:hypothetical protein
MNCPHDPPPSSPFGFACWAQQAHAWRRSLGLTSARNAAPLPSHVHRKEGKKSPVYKPPPQRKKSPRGASLKLL